MTKHTCKHCNCIFEYCRGCLVSPIPYKDAGYCSKSCYEASKINVETKMVVEDINPVEENVLVEVEVETISSTTTTANSEHTTKNEASNTYNKKKNKYK